MQNLKPIYSGDRRALANARNLLAAASRAESLKWTPSLVAGIREWLDAYPPLASDLRAQMAKGNKGNSRPCQRSVALKVVFIDEGGGGQGRLGELLMEQIGGAATTGELYPADSMAGVQTDAAWDDSLKAALRYARECSLGVTPGTDVRWSVRQLPPGEPWDEDSPKHRPRPLEHGAQISGRSAGVAFFLGLFALAQTEDAPGEWKADELVKRIVALATLPETEDRTAVDPLGTLGGDEAKKLDALKDLPTDMRVLVVFPRAYTGRNPFGYDVLKVTTVAELAAVLRQRSAPPTWPDSLPHSRRATDYIDSRDEVGRLTKSLRSSRIHVVSGPGGVGKTARIVKATDALLQEGVFPGGRFWIDLYDAGEPRRKAGKVIATTRGFEAEDKFDELRDQTQRLLAKPSLVLLEGAETVPEKDIAGLLDWFTGPTTVVWMTRRKTDAGHPNLRGAKHHSVDALSPVDALELLCYAAERKVEELSLTERADLEEIAKAAENLPLLLGWAGAALQSDRGTTPAKYLAELRAHPLGSIADPDDRDRLNAGRFLRRSLARIVATAEMPDLPALANRLFAGLAAFDPSYGAPLSWWPLAAGLDTRDPKGRERLAAARRALRGLGLVTSEASPPSDGASAETLHAVHVLAGAVAADLWHSQPVALVRATIGALCKAATAALKAPLPTDWFRNAVWLARRTSEAAHFDHWLSELDVVRSQTELEDTLTAADTLRHAWVNFLEKDAEFQPLFGLKETAWTAVCRHSQQIAGAHPEAADFLRQLAVSWDHLGYVRLERQELSGAEIAFNEGMEINKKLAEEHPDVADYQDGLAGAWVHLGEVHKVREKWADAEAAFNKAKAICEKLTATYPDLADFQHGLAILWQHLGDIHKARQDWAGGEKAFSEAKAICKTLTDMYPNEGEYWRSLAVSLGGLGDMRLERRDWAGAKTAINVTRTIWQKLAGLFPDVADFQDGLAVSLDNLGDVCVGQHNLAEAEKLSRESLRIAEGLTLRCSGVPSFEERVLAGMWRLAQLLMRMGRSKEAASVAHAGLGRSKRLASLLQETGAKLTERQEQIITGLANLAGPETGTA